MEDDATIQRTRRKFCFPHRSPPKDRKKRSFASPPKDATESEAPLPDWDAASYAQSHRSDGPPSARSFARSFRSDGSEVKQQDPDYDDRSVSKSYRSDGTEIIQGDADYDDPSAVASVRSYRADGTELRPGDPDWDDLSHVSFARSVTSIDELSVHTYDMDGSPLKFEATIRYAHQGLSGRASKSDVPIGRTAAS